MSDQDPGQLHPATDHLTPILWLFVGAFLTLHCSISYPLAFAFVLIFHRWNIYTPMKWVGLGNIRLLLTDPLVWRALGNTLYFLLIHIPLQLVIALGLAQLLNQKIRGRAFFRASYFLPFIISGVVVTILWQQLYAVETGIINVLLQLIGLPKIGWLTDRRFAMPAIAIMATWKNVGLYIVLFLVGLQTIPSHLYEAAELDGASGWQRVAGPNDENDRVSREGIRAGDDSVRGAEGWHGQDDGRAEVDPSSSWRTRSARACAVNGFIRNETSADCTPRRRTSSLVRWTPAKSMRRT